MFSVSWSQPESYWLKGSSPTLRPAYESFLGAPSFLQELNPPATQLKILNTSLLPHYLLVTTKITPAIPRSHLITALGIWSYLAMWMLWETDNRKPKSTILNNKDILLPQLTRSPEVEEFQGWKIHWLSNAIFGLGFLHHSILPSTVYWYLSSTWLLAAITPSILSLSNKLQSHGD